MLLKKKEKAQKKNEVVLKEIVFETHPTPKDDTPHVIMHLNGEEKSNVIRLGPSQLLKLFNTVLGAIISMNKDEEKCISTEKKQDVMFR